MSKVSVIINCFYGVGLLICAFTATYRLHYKIDGILKSHMMMLVGWSVFICSAFLFLGLLNGTNVNHSLFEVGLIDAIALKQVAVLYNIKKLGCRLPEFKHAQQDVPYHFILTARNNSENKSVL